jgi:hypothetical protein
MNRTKVVITGGCSYSQFNNLDVTWPKHLIDELKPDKIGLTGHGSVGNEYISRIVISTVQLALDEGYKPEDILVGVVWSGCDRGLYYSESVNTWDRATIMPNCGDRKEDQKNWSENSVRQQNKFSNLGNLITFSEYEDNFHIYAHWLASSPMTIRDSKKSNFYTLNGHWDDELSIGYYSNYTNPVYAIMQTCEHVLRTQWFLKSLNIKYFMTEYDHDVFTYMGPVKLDAYPNSGHREGVSAHIIPVDLKDIVSRSEADAKKAIRDKKHKEEMFTRHNHPEVNYLYDMIDKDYWLPVRDLKDWTLNKSPYEQRESTDPHPSTEQQKDFTERVILPFLLEKYNIS